MAMSIPVQSPSSSPAPQSPQSSADGSNGPSTPVSPSAVQTLALPPPADNSDSTGAGVSASGHGNGHPAQPQKRKPSRRANTAERRATHNAVERARRETLNGRFLDLAALLPNLSQIRRPSKSSIVNSSIAHIHASRRHRLLAARELRMLKVEADALRRELNEWRDRSGIPRIEEPVRGEGFQMIMSGEVEILSAGLIEEEDGDEYGDEDGYGQSGAMPSSAPHGVQGMQDDQEDMRHPFAHSVHHNLGHHGHPQAQHPHHGLHLQTILPRPAMAGGAPSPMIVQSPNTVSFENPAMASMYDPPHMTAQQQPFFPSDGPNNKWGMYPHQAQQQFTPPASSHGVVPSQQQHSSYGGMNGSYQRQPQYHGHQQQQQQARGGLYGSPVPLDNDDASSVGSAAGHSPVPGAQQQLKRERSGSMGSVGSNGEMPVVLGGGMGRRNGGGGSPGSWEAAESMVGMNVVGMGGMGMNGMGGLGGMGMGGGMNGMGMPGRGAAANMNVGGGGNAFAAMML